jgi:hypothetical protein
LGFSRDHDLEAAKAIFAEKFGYQPAEAVYIGVDLLVGPVGVEPKDTPQTTEPAPEGETAAPVQQRLL